ncbi:hypothetical protein KIL84_008446 [Mauremys mutica]|uniref:Uncharacterized protein n=1 Tax=Mauremys mutica TaxID=74926 RepID=A0A9D3X5R9_9SAUR|nr:hypothetical protein KIL84_008446 [Mauremys mutica]
MVFEFILFWRSLGFKPPECMGFAAIDILRKLFQTDDSPKSASCEMDQATVSVTKVSLTPHLPVDFRQVTAMHGELECSTMKTKVKVEALLHQKDGRSRTPRLIPSGEGSCNINTRPCQP